MLKIHNIYYATKIESAIKSFSSTQSLYFYSFDNAQSGYWKFWWPNIMSVHLSRFTAISSKTHIPRFGRCSNLFFEKNFRQGMLSSTDWKKAQVAVNVKTITVACIQLSLCDSQTTPAGDHSVVTKPCAISGERGRIRTCDPVIKSHLLYQLSYAPV